MLQYLVILLSDDSVSYCYYDTKPKGNKLISQEDLKEGILFAMKENLNIQFVYPKEELPQEYKQIIHMIDHTDIRHISSNEKADVLVADSIEEFANYKAKEDDVVVIRCEKRELFEKKDLLLSHLNSLKRINIVIKDIETFSDNDFQTYKSVLEDISKAIESAYKQGSFVQVNILTDRMMLDKMNNCNAGDNNLTLAPNGKFYVCPAFYYDDEQAVGSLEDGINIKNAQLYKLEYAPLCRECDSYHCKRCVWMNKLTTLEVNTPSHEQCVVSHLERNAARDFLLMTNIFDKQIKEISYLDPFDVRKQW